jgi:hypothetical protein
VREAGDDFVAPICVFKMPSFPSDGCSIQIQVSHGFEMQGNCEEGRSIRRFEWVFAKSDGWTASNIFRSLASQKRLLNGLRKESCFLQAPCYTLKESSRAIQLIVL